MMRSFKLLLAVAFSLSVLALATRSQAQSGRSDDGYIYTFTDDDLIGDTLGTTTALLRIRPPAAHVTLIRPRASFVPEMLKSIELM